MSSSQQGQQRLTLRQADAQDRRHRMTQQRQEMTHRIRKQKKSEYLARKRNFAATATTTTTTTMTTTTTTTMSTTVTSSSTNRSAMDGIRPLIQDFCHSSTSSITMPTTTVLEKLQALHDALQSTTLEATEENWLVVLPADDLATASSLLERLQGTASASNSSEAAGLTTTWVLNILVRLTAVSYTPPTSAAGSSLSYYGRPPLSWSSLLAHNSAWLSRLIQLAPHSEAACVVLGNLVGEANASSASFRQMRQAGLIPALLSAIHRPAAAWALTNAIRYDTAEYAQVYCNDQALSAALLEQLLLEEPVATQAAWILATLTNREEDVVRYLMSHPTFPTTLIACMKRPTCKEQLAPLVQALGNIATCSTTGEGEGGPPFAANLLTALPMLTPMLGQLLQIPTNREVVHQAAWLAGCLLHDARIPNHPATIIAAPHLVPRLFQELRENTPHSLDNQRELTHALWNALTEPSSSVAAAAAAAADGVIRTGESAGNHHLPLPFLPSWELVRSSLFTLVKLAGSSFDMDASVAAVSVLELLLQQQCYQGQLLEALDEQDIITVLEGVCDTPNEEAAEIAANLLDNYFYVDDVEEEDYYHHHHDGGGSAGFVHIDNSFMNDAAAAPPSLQQGGPILAFGGAASLRPQQQQQQQQQQAAMMGEPSRMMMGRGRGAPIPSWMAQQGQP